MKNKVFVFGAGASYASGRTPLGKDLIWSYFLDCSTLFRIEGGKPAKEDLKEKNRVNISFRSKGNGDTIDVNKIASVFGGGGHMRASGCVISGTLEEAKKKVLAEVEKALKRK